MNGSKSRSEIGEKNEFPTIWNYLWAAYGSSRSTYGPTQTHEESLQNASVIYDELKSEVDIIIQLLEPIENDLKRINAPNVRY